MNDFYKIIKSRRSVRGFTSEPIPEDKLARILEAGTYAPSGMGRQSPQIVAVTDKVYRNRISKLNAEIMGTDKDPYYGAPVIILVLADGNAHTFVEDGSCVMENLMLAATAEELGSIWIHREREIFDSESGKELLREWGLSENLRGVGAVALGYPSVKPNDAAPRKNDYIKLI